MVQLSAGALLDGAEDPVAVLVAPGEGQEDVKGLGVERKQGQDRRRVGGHARHYSPEGYSVKGYNSRPTLWPPGASLPEWLGKSRSPPAESSAGA